MISITDILKSLATIVSSFKRPEAITKEAAKRKAIKNETRKKRHELKRLRLEKKIEKRANKKGR